MAAKLFAHLRGQWIGVIALLLVLTGGTAYALEGSNTVFSDDIVNGEVKNADLGADAVGSGKILDQQVKNADLGLGASSSNTIADGGVRGIDVATNSLKGADIDEATLDIGDAARAYAYVSHLSCTGTPGTCTLEQSKGISSVTRLSTGFYCVIAPGIDAAQTPAAVTVEWQTTPEPTGNASAMTNEVFGGCGPSGFVVNTQRQGHVSDHTGFEYSLAAEDANNVSFTIVIP